MTNIGQRIKALRERACLTQEMLANRTGMTQGYIAKLEAGKITPSLKSLEKLAQALGLEIYDFWRE